MTVETEMNDIPKPEDDEFSAMHALYKALQPLDEEARSRVLGYVVARLGISVPSGVKPTTGDQDSVSGNGEGEGKDDHREQFKTKYTTIAELFDATQPRSHAEKALVSGYWLQNCQGAESFDGQSANKELKHLGHGVQNITNAINALKSQKPALALQLKKSGTTQQARKVYKITAAGIKAVEDMIHG